MDGMEGKHLSEMISLKGKTALVTDASGMAVFFSFTSFLYSSIILFFVSTKAPLLFCLS